MRKRLPLILILPIACVLWATNAIADGHILKIEGDIAYVSMGAKDGVGPGAVLTLMHTVTARDPDGGKTLKGVFPVGTLKVLRVGEHLGLAQAEALIAHRLRIGGQVRLTSSPRKFKDSWVPDASEQVDPVTGDKVSNEGLLDESDTSAEGKKARDERRRRERERADESIRTGEALASAFSETLGKPIEARLLAWQAFVKKHPNVNKETVDAEMATLLEIKQQLLEADQAKVPAEIAQRNSRLTRLQEIDTPMQGPLLQNVPKRAYEGGGIQLAFWVDPSQPIAKATIYYRASSDESYKWLSMAADGDGYLRVEIPADTVRAPQLQYFVEAKEMGKEYSTAVLGTMRRPFTVTVEPPVVSESPNRTGRSQIRLFSDYVDFDGGFGSGFDQYVHIEGDFMYRFYEPVYSVRLGFGTLGGVGGPKDIIDESPELCEDVNGNYRCRKVDYTYVYSEFEFRLGEIVALMVRPQFGTGSRDRRISGVMNPSRCAGSDLEDCDFFSSFGARGRIRFGDELSSNLTLGFGFIGELGTLFDAAFTWDAIKNVPIVLTAQVADQPVPEDFGVRLIADVGWRALHWVYPSLRFSYQARDVDHAGVSGGAAVNFDW